MAVVAYYPGAIGSEAYTPGLIKTDRTVPMSFQKQWNIGDQKVTTVKTEESNMATRHSTTTRAGQG